MVNCIWNDQAKNSLCGTRDWPGGDECCVLSVDDVLYGCEMTLVSCPDCLAEGEKVRREGGIPTPPPKPFEEHLEDVLVEINDMMTGRHAKYGPGNIAEFGPLGILVRMSDKFSRLKNGQENHDDETIENTLDDVIGYALIWKLWLRKEWPGSE